MEISLWEDPDGFVAEFNCMPEAERHGYQKTILEVTGFGSFGVLARSFINGVDQAKTHRRPTRFANDNDPLEADFQAKAGTQKADPFETAFGEPRLHEGGTP